MGEDVVGNLRGAAANLLHILACQLGNGPEFQAECNSVIS